MSCPWGSGPTCLPQLLGRSHQRESLLVLPRSRTSQNTGGCSLCWPQLCTLRAEEPLGSLSHASFCGPPSLHLRPCYWVVIDCLAAGLHVHHQGQLPSNDSLPAETLGLSLILFQRLPMGLHLNYSLGHSHPGWARLTLRFPQLFLVLFTQVWPLLSLKVISPAKMGLFRGSRELRFRTCKLRQNHRQVQQRREKLFYRKGGS